MCEISDEEAYLLSCTPLYSHLYGDKIPVVYSNRKPSDLITVKEVDLMVIKKIKSTGEPLMGNRVMILLQPISGRGVYRSTYQELFDCWYDANPHYISIHDVLAKINEGDVKQEQPEWPDNPCDMGAI